MQDLFIKLDDVLLPQPLPAILSLLMTLGLTLLAGLLTRLLRGDRGKALDWIGCFFLVVGFIAVVVHTIAMCGLSHRTFHWTLRILGWVLAIVGVAQLRHAPCIF